jgi:hypothetical protein
MKTRFSMFFVLAFALTSLLSAGTALAKPLANHTRGTALEVSLGTLYGPYDTSGTGGGLNVTCGSGHMSHVIWFKYTPSSTGTMISNTFGSNYDTMLAVFDGRTEVACNDDGGAGGLQSQVSFSATAGTTYYFAVGSYAHDDYGNAFFTP